MSNPLHAQYYADSASWTTAAILENVAVARDTYRVRFDCPTIAARMTPGQFVMLRLAGCDDPLLGRPLALYDTVVSSSGEATGLDVVYLVAGKFTRRLARLPARSTLRGLGSAREWIFRAGSRASDHGGRRYRSDAVFGIGCRMLEPQALRATARVARLVRNKSLFVMAPGVRRFWPELMISGTWESMFA